MKRFHITAQEPTEQEKQFFMKLALKQAEKALALGEIPVGAVVVRRGAVVSCACNERETKKNALYHGEILAIDRACKALGGWRLWDCDLYVTLEPCVMCAGAISNARIRKVFFGASDPKAGAFGGKFQINDLDLPHKPLWEQGCGSEEAEELLKDFFDALRNKQ